MLSKSQFIRGRQCHKSLWLYNHRPELREKPRGTQQALFDSGTDVGVLAQKLFSDGLAIPFEGLRYGDQVQMTHQAMADGVSTIYEAAFIHDGVFVKVDLLHRGPKGWEVYEVKSSTGCKGVYLDDIAVQVRTVQGAGVQVARAALVHINNTYRRQGPIDVHQLFSIVDVTENVLSRQESISLEIARQHHVISGEEPATDIGPHCSDPYDCDFRPHCWAHVPSPSVFDLRDRGRPNAFALYQDGIVRFEDIPQSKLGWRQRLQVNGTLHQQDHIDPAALRNFLDGLWYPLCFLDFETTYMTPVPLFDGTRPYEQVPFQFSLHIQEEPEGEVQHVEFLANGLDDPQEDFILALVDALPENGCILTYNQRFEIGILEGLATRLPEWRRHVDAIIPNVRDLMSPFRSKHLYCWQMDGSYSIKKVLPALAPDLSYKNLEINNGEMAASAFLHLRALADPEEVATMSRQLKDYCRLDTWAMVVILEKMKELAT